MDIRVAIKAFVICQSKKVLILLTRGEIPRLHRLLSKYLNRRRANQGHT